MEKKLGKIAEALYQVHSFAKLIGDNYSHITSSDYDGAGSDHVLAFVNLVQEKAEFCIKIIENEEVTA
jgi:hypothetical protein